MDFQVAWDFLDNLQFFKIKLGLDSMNKFLERLGSPHHKTKFVHIAGTNGKGSTAVALQTLLTEAGYQAGLYTSPHLSSVRERFSINNSYISHHEFAASAEKIINVLDGEQITYFEFTTALAFLWFAEKEVDLAILEVGLGGRLDATNVIIPQVSVITNVSMDHEAYLGDNLVAVAGEKAGVVKSGVPLVSGVIDPTCGPVVDEHATELGAPLYRLDRDFSMSRAEQGKYRYNGIGGEIYDGLRLGLPGRYQSDNCALVLAVAELLARDDFEISEKNVRSSLKMTRWPGRLEEFTKNIDQLKCRFLLDGAHNPAGVAALLDALENDLGYTRLIMVWASMADKDISSCLPIVSPLCDTIILTRPENNRSATTSQLRNCLPEAEQFKCLECPEVEKALTTAMGLVEEDDLICVAGSLYLVGKARSILLGELVDG